MLIDKYIENALYLYQCVIVPGFGGFLAIETPSSQDASTGKSTPSSKKFSFNPTLRVNDGVLASYIANMRDVSYADALLEISHAVDYYLSRLAKGDSVEIAGVGMIKPAEDGSWAFTPYGEKSFSRENYGLESSVPEAEKEDVNPENEKEENISEEKTIEEEEKPHTGRTGRIIWISLVCGLAAICVVVLAFWGRINTFFTQEQKEIKTVEMVPLTPALTDTLAKKDTVKIDTTALLPVVTDLDSMTVDRVFYVVAASLSKKENAENEISNLRAQGYPAVYAGRQNGLYMVAYGGYDDRKEATEVLDSIVNVKNTEAWIKVYDANKKK